MSQNIKTTIAHNLYDRLQGSVLTAILPFSSSDLLLMFESKNSFQFSASRDTFQFLNYHAQISYFGYYTFTPGI